MATNLFLLVSISLFSFHTFSCDNVYRLHYPCPSAILKPPIKSENTLEERRNGFYGRPSIAPTEVPQSFEDQGLALNIPWDEFIEHANKLLRANAEPFEIENLIFANIVTIQEASKGQYQRFRRYLNLCGKPLAEVFLRNLSNARRRTK